jgi:iron complex outermembrane recepter protein
VTAHARYDFSAGGKPSFVAASVGHTGNRTVSFDGNLGNPNYRLPSYTTLDVNGGITVGGFDVGLYVRNLTDERGQVSAYTQFAGLGVPNWINYIRPRTIGITASRLF